MTSSLSNDADAVPYGLEIRQHVVEEVLVAVDDDGARRLGDAEGDDAAPESLRRLAVARRRAEN